MISDSNNSDADTDTDSDGKNIQRYEMKTISKYSTKWLSIDYLWI